MVLSYSGQKTPEELADDTREVKKLKDIIKSLSEREKKVLKLRYYQGYTFEAMRDHFGGISKSLLSRIHRNALSKIKKVW